MDNLYYFLFFYYLCNMKRRNLLFAVWILLFCSCVRTIPENIREVVCVPVYGQSLALGEEAERITDFDSLSAGYGHRIVTQRLDEDFGFFDDSQIKQDLKRLVDYDKRSFELNCYGMSEEFLARSQRKDFLFCTFPGGRGATSIVDMGPGTAPYRKFLEEIREANDEAVDRGLKFTLPAYVWMQGENDIVWRTSKDYREDLLAFHQTFGKDVQKVTGQETPPVCICYQSNCLSLSKGETADSLYERPEIYVPNGQLQLIQERKDFFASGPTYAYPCVNDRIHIDGLSQNQLGHLTGLALWRCLNGQNSDGLSPKNFRIHGNTISLTFYLPSAPLVLDTVEVRPVRNYGFNVVNHNNHDIVRGVTLRNDTVVIECSENPLGCKLRYAVNGERDKSGRNYGSRGNLRDSQGEQFKALIQGKEYPLNNWCYQFELMVGQR